jgi:hypothetical protein
MGDGQVVALEDDQGEVLGGLAVDEHGVSFLPS